MRPPRQILLPGPPQRLRLSRRRGDRLPDNAVSVARPTRWGNPFTVHPLPDGTWTVRDLGDLSRSLREEPPRCPDKWSATVMAVRLFELHCRPAPEGLRTLYPDYPNPAELAGLHLACWCSPLLPCHADSLLRLANPEPT